MESITTQEDLALFLKNPENAQKLNGLVEDIRDALIEYQVCSPKSLALVVANICSDFVATGHLQGGLSADRESHFLQPTICSNLRIGRCRPTSSGKDASHR